MFIVDEPVSENTIAEITKAIISTPSTNQSMNTNTAKPRAAGKGRVQNQLKIWSEI